MHFLVTRYAFYALFACQICSAMNTMDSKMLNVGEELWNETLPLQAQGGSRLYQLQGFKQLTWYEVKISYPASIPASFSLELKRGVFDTSLRMNRRLLNTEKIIIKTEGGMNQTSQDEIYVLVSVIPAGFVAIPNAGEQKIVIYNIVCDELLLGIPHKAWWVVIFVILCISLSFIAPSFLPPYLLHKSENPATVSKDS